MLGEFLHHTWNMSENQGGSLVVDVNVTSFDREYLHWSSIVMEVAAVVVIVVGDISMLMMFFTRKLLGQSTNILVFSVAIGDLVTGLLALPLAMMQKILVDPSDFLCKGYFYFANVSKTAVGYTILLLAMERIIALLIQTFRILPPGRCLFFASLTWFFAAAYNIWSVVIYDVEVVTLIGDPERRTKDLFLCFASSRFMYLHDIFEILNPLVTFLFPTIGSTLLFVYFIWNKEEAEKPGRPYKSSKSVVIFTFALLISFVLSHLPWEIATLVLNHDATRHYSRQLLSLKVLHLISFSRGFWDIFIFGAFRHYVCKKEKALAHFREQRSLQVQRSSLAIPLSDRAMSTSLLDSDPSVSRRYSSDISRRPSAFEDGPSCAQVEHHLGSSLHPSLSHTSQYSHHLDPNDPVSKMMPPPTQHQQQQQQLHQQHNLGSSLLPRLITDREVVTVATSGNSEDEKEKTIIVPVVTVGYLIPRSPCADPVRNFLFPPSSKPNMDRRMSTPGRHLPTEVEDIKEAEEGEDSVTELQSYPKKAPIFSRRKSCGDKTTLARHLNQRQVPNLFSKDLKGTAADNSHQDKAQINSSNDSQSKNAPKQDNEISTNDFSSVNSDDADTPTQQPLSLTDTVCKKNGADSLISEVTVNPEVPAAIDNEDTRNLCTAPLLSSADKSRRMLSMTSPRKLKTSCSEEKLPQTSTNDLLMPPGRSCKTSQSFTHLRRGSNHLHVPGYVPRSAYNSTES